MRTINYSFHGLIVPVFTPFNNDQDRSLNLSVIPEYARYLQAKNISGILVNGSTGEGTSLTFEERKCVAEAWADAIKETKQHLMIQVGGAPLKEAKELTAHAESIGADSILCLPELYFKPTTASELVDYLRIIGESAPKTPLFYYDFPKATNVNICMGQLFKAVSGKIPTFAGVKTDLERGMQARQACSNYTIFLAGDMMMLSGCAAGMESYIMTSLNFLQEPAFSLIEFAKGNNDLNSARKSQEFINKVIAEITRHGSWVQSMKLAMNLTTDFFMGPPRAPNKLLTRESAEAMEKGLSNLGIKTMKTAILKMY